MQKFFDRIDQGNATVPKGRYKIECIVTPLQGYLHVEVVPPAKAGGYRRYVPSGRLRHMKIYR